MRDRIAARAGQADKVFNKLGYVRKETVFLAGLGTVHQSRVPPRSYRHSEHTQLRNWLIAVPRDLRSSGVCGMNVKDSDRQR